MFLWNVSRLCLKCDGTRTETQFHLSVKRMSPFKSAGASVQSTAGSWIVRISGSNGSNAGYTMFWGGVKGTGYPLHSPVSPSLPLPCITFQLDSIYAQDCKMSQSWKLNVLNCVVGYTLFLVMCYRGWWRWTTTVCSSSGCADVPSSTQVSSGMSYSLSAPSDSRRYGSEAEYLITWFSK